MRKYGNNSNNNGNKVTINNGRENDSEDYLSKLIKMKKFKEQ